MKILVAMSGGVDSSLAAALLTERGHEVTGVHLKLADVPVAAQVPGQGCCTLDDAQDARRVAQVLDVAFYVWDLREVFERDVERPFIAAYASGRTPNPCIACNRHVKYAALLQRAVALGFDALATGHHVRRRRDPAGRYRLLRAADRNKDQSYVLYTATQRQLAHSRFPVGELTKDEIRAQAEQRGLRVAAKPDSYDLCFVPGGDTADYLARRLPAVAGPIVDTNGVVLGQHQGLWRYTIGQRRGLKLAIHQRRYVVRLDPSRNTVVVGDRASLACRWVQLGQSSWVRRFAPVGPVLAQIRAHSAAVAATLEHRESGYRVTFERPVDGVAVGQACVLYAPDDGLECLGGGTIVAADRAAVTAAATVTAPYDPNAARKAIRGRD